MITRGRGPSRPPDRSQRNIAGQNTGVFRAKSLAEGTLSVNPDDGTPLAGSADEFNNQFVRAVAIANSSSTVQFGVPSGPNIFAPGIPLTKHVFNGITVCLSAEGAAQANRINFEIFSGATSIYFGFIGPLLAGTYANFIATGLHISGRPNEPLSILTTGALAGGNSISFVESWYDI